MKQTGKLILLFFLLTTLCINRLHAQLYGIGQNKAVLVEYKIKVNGIDKPIAIDSIFAYNETPANWNTKSGSLKAVSPDSTGGWTFHFSVFHKEDTSYHDSLPAFTNDSVHVFSNLKAGGYSIRMQKDTIDTTFRAWIFINKLRFYIVKDADGNVKDFDSDCEYVDLRAYSHDDIPNNTDYIDTLTFYHKNFEYIDPFTGRPFTLRNIMKNTWQGGDTSTVNSSEKWRLYDPPAVSTMFRAHISDIFDNTAEDKVYYKTINTKAAFEIYYIDTISKTELDPFVSDTTVAHYKKVDTDAKGEAPYHAMFVNKSKNGHNFEWIMSDTIYKEKGPIDSAHYFTNDSTSPVFHIYRYPYEQKPFKYPLKLISTSTEGCRDTSEVITLEVEASLLNDNSGKNAFPTAFAPDDDRHPKNKFFYFKEDDAKIYWKSIQHLHLWIYNKMGKEVYEYNGPMFTGWQGWDGKTEWGAKAPSDVYYYYFEATGWGLFKTKDAAPDAKGQDILSGKGYVFLYRQSQ